MSRVAVSADVLRWAIERSGRTFTELEDRFPKIREWLSGQTNPTLRQLEALAKATLTPLGYLFLPKPPEEQLPIPDFRTASGEGVARPSADLLDTIYAMQRRQAWLRETLVEAEAEPLAFVGSAQLTDNPEAIGREMRRILGVDEDWANALPTWQDALGELRRAIERLNVMAVINGVVGNNPHRPLDVAEFRGFALSDPFAPLIFVNGADARAAQMFTLAHELAHIWLGAEGLSGYEGIFPGGRDVEDWCNRAAAEFLAPAAEVKTAWHEAKREAEPFSVLAKRFKVSPIVAGRRALDLRLVNRETFFAFYDAYVAEEQTQRTTAGGDFYNNQNTRIGELFAGHVVRAALEGRIGFKEAYELTGLRGDAFQKYARRLGFVF